MIRLFSNGASQQGAQTSLSGMRILVVEDDEDALEIVGLTLSAAGAEVTLASDADQAFRAIGLYKPDAIVSDVGMPGEDGLALLRRIRALSPSLGGQTPVVALTAFSAKRDQDEAERAGFTVYMTKPLDANALLSVLASFKPRPSKGEAP